ncbi:MAG: PKD domain-containing protein, partial [Methanobacteriota archaeon]
NHPSLAVDSFGAIHLVWEDNREGTCSIFYANSLDNFADSVKVNDDLLEGNQWDASVDVGSNGVIHVVWEAHTDIYYARSTDGGLSFNTTGRINDDVGGETQGSASMVVEDGGKIHVVWEDSRNIDADVYYVRSTDDGLTFESNIRINTDASGQGQTTPSIDIGPGGIIHVVWADARLSNWDIFYSVSFDGGASFQYNEKINDDYDPLTKIWQVRPSVAAEGGGYFHAAWKDARKRTAGLLYDVFYAKGKVSTLSYEWDFGDGSPPEAGVGATHIYSVVATYIVTLTVTDDQGASDSDTCEVIVEVKDKPPVADANGPYYADEASPVSLDASGSYDPDGDPLEYRWDFDDDGTWDTGWSPIPFINHTWGDDYSGDVVLEVTDGVDTDTDNATVVIRNVDPTAEILDVYLNVNFTLRVAGEKWHNVEMYLYEDGVEIGYAEVVRFPGSPDDQSVTISDVRCVLSSEYTALVHYSPDDDPINGQIFGASPAWIILTFDDGTNATLNHTFNVRHPDTWIWNAHLNPYFLGHEITFEASASDPGSDDLTFMWDWGDGTPVNVATYYNDGVGPDPYPSPDVNPITASDVQTHAYGTSGTYTVLLTVEDDDVGSVTISFDLTL